MESKNIQPPKLDIKPPHICHQQPNSHLPTIQWSLVALYRATANPWIQSCHVQGCLALPLLKQATNIHFTTLSSC